MKTKTRYQLTLTIDSYTELRALAKKAGFPHQWVSDQVDGFVQGILPVVRQAAKDAEEKKNLTEQEMREKYGEIAIKSFGLTDEDLKTFK